RRSATTSRITPYPSLLPHDTSPPEIYTLSLHDALPICEALHAHGDLAGLGTEQRALHADHVPQIEQFHHLVLPSPDGVDLEVDLDLPGAILEGTEGHLEARSGKIQDRKSTRLNSSHGRISYAVF